MRVKFLQTADEVSYKPLLEVSSRSVRAFCAINGYDYEAFVGLRHGWHAAHATFNRIDMLFDEVEAGFRGWLVYLDADAFIDDLSFDFTGYLAGHGDAFMIARAVWPDDAPTWNVNAGVLILNTTNPTAIDVIRQWRMLLHAWPVALVTLLPPRWAITNDQQLLHLVLRLHRRRLHTMHFEHPDLINSQPATFIAQILKSDRPDFEVRLAEIRDRVEAALSRYAGRTGISSSSPTSDPGSSPRSQG